jgi:hypothetical protein
MILVNDFRPERTVVRDQERHGTIPIANAGWKLIDLDNDNWRLWQVRVPGAYELPTDYGRVRRGDHVSQFFKPKAVDSTDESSRVACWSWDVKLHDRQEGRRRYVFRDRVVSDEVWKSIQVITEALRAGDVLIYHYRCSERAAIERSIKRNLSEVFTLRLIEIHE